MGHQQGLTLVGAWSKSGADEIGVLGVALKIFPNKRAIGKNLERVTAGVLEGGARETAANAATLKFRRHIGVDQGNRITALFVCQECRVAVEYGFKTRINLIVFDRQ